MSTLSNQVTDCKAYATFYESEKKPNPVRFGYAPFMKLYELLQTHDIRSEKSGAAFALHQLREGGSRRNRDVVSISGCVADIDKGPSYEELKTLIPWDHAAYSTHSHNPASGNHKYRVVIPFQHKVPPEDYPAIWAHINATMDNVMDVACKDPARLYYLPSCPLDKEQDKFTCIQPGVIFDPGEVSATRAGVSSTAPRLQTFQSPPPDLRMVEAMLGFINPFTERAQWMEILFALSSTYGAQTEDLAHRWSRGDLLSGGEHAS